MAPVAPLTEPFKLITGAFAQTDAAVPAFTMGAGVKVITRLSETATQFPLPVVVSVRVSVPAASSAAVGV